MKPPEVFWYFVGMGVFMLCMLGGIALTTWAS